MTNLRTTTGGIDAVTRIGKALDHPLRVRALAALRDGELCVCELIALLRLAPSTVSKHMAIIADAGLVNRRRDGKWTYYSLANDPPEIAETTALVLALVENDSLVREDRGHVPALDCSPHDARDSE